MATNPFTPTGPFPAKDGFIYTSDLDNPLNFETPIDAGTLFNERGYNKSSTISRDGEEIINDFNGALSYKVPLYNFKGPGDLKVDLSLTYCSNVDHTIVSANKTFIDSNVEYIQYNYGFPEWILNLNGVGVQVMNLQDNFFTQIDPAHPNDFVTGQKVRYLVNGYHITHEMQVPDTDHRDRIYVLQGDGSVDTLINSATTFNPLPDPPYERTGYTKGNYVSESGSDFSRAFVEFINPPAPISGEYNLRRMYYMKGDGITYIYEEIYNNFDTEHYPEPTYGIHKTKVFILKSIKDRYGNILEIQHAPKWPIREVPEPGDQIIPCRPLLWFIKSNWDNCSEIGFDWRFIGDQKKLHIYNTTQGNHEITFQDPIGFNPVGSPNTNIQRIGRITSIKNPVEQEMLINYENYNRKMISMFFGNRITIIATMKVNNNNLWRIVGITNYSGGDSDYIYVPRAVPEEEVIMSLGQVFKAIQSQNGWDFKGQGRDLFFVNMLQEVTRRLGSTVIQKQFFKYMFIPQRSYPDGSTTPEGTGNPRYPELGNGDRFNNPIHFNDDYITLKEVYDGVESNLNETYKKILEKRIYKAYPVKSYQFNFANKDSGCKIKIVYEEHRRWDKLNNNYFPVPFLKKNYTYKTGLYSPAVGIGVMFTGGSFLLASFEEIYDNVSSKKESFEYTHFTDGDSSWFSRNAWLNPVKQVTKNLPLINDVISGTEVQRFNVLFLDNNYPLENGKYNPASGATQTFDPKNKFIYLIGLKIFESSLDNLGKGKVQTWTYNEISNDTIYFGTLKSHSIVNEGNASVILNTNFSYAKYYTLGRDLYTPQSAMPSIEGNLVSSTSPQGNVTKLYYHPVEAGEISNPGGATPEIEGLLMFNTETIVPLSQVFQDRRLPTRTDYYPSGVSNYPIRNYKLYNCSGINWISMSPDKFLSSINLDGVNRLLNLTKPYDYNLVTASSYTNKFEYDDTQNLVTSLSKLDGTVDKKVENYFDGFNKLIKSRSIVDLSHYNENLFYYDYLNQKSKFIDAMGYATKYSYDEFGNLKQTEFQDGSISKMEITFLESLSNYNGQSVYKIFIRKFTYIDEIGYTTEKYIDFLGNLRREVKFIPNVREPEAPVDVFAPYKALQTDYVYSALNRLTKVITPSGKIINYAYDGFGRLIQRTTPDSGSTRFLYDNDSNLVYSQTNLQASQVNVYNFYSYDNANRLLGVGESAVFVGNSLPEENFPEFDYINPDEKYFFQDVNYSDAPLSNLYDYLIYNVYDDVANSPSGFLDIPSDYYDFENYTLGLVACTAFRTRKTDNWNFKYYRYDVRGRIIRMWLIFDDIGIKIIDFKYNSMDQITHVINATSLEEIDFKYSYDNVARIAKVEIISTAEDVLVEYEYNPNSLLSISRFNNAGMTLTYGYDVRNRVNYIGDENEFYSYNLDYYANSNVKEQIINGNYTDYFTNTEHIGQQFTYDTASRLLKSERISTDYFNANLSNTYDADGNILKLIRSYNGDNFNYQYQSSTNKLLKVSGSENQFEYDRNGNLLLDKLSKNSNMIYDYRNLLLEVKSEYGTSDPPTYYYTRYWYDEAGNRIKKLVLNSATSDPEYPDWNNPTSSGDWLIYDEIHYLRNYSGKTLVEYKNSSFDFYNIWGIDLVGQYKSNKDKKFYYKDHLRSIRCIMDDENNIISATDYDSWGNIVREWQPTSDYKFSSKEHDFESSYDYFGARNYYARIGRWIQVDPMMSKHYDFTPYNYVLNNPLTLIDPDGKQVNPNNSINVEGEIQQGLNSVESGIQEGIKNVSETTEKALEFIFDDVWKTATTDFAEKGMEKIGVKIGVPAIVGKVVSKIAGAVLDVLLDPNDKTETNASKIDFNNWKAEEIKKQDELEQKKNQEKISKGKGVVKNMRPED